MRGSFIGEVKKRAFKNMYPATIQVSYNRNMKAWLDPRIYGCQLFDDCTHYPFSPQSGHISVPFSLDNRESQILWRTVIKSHWIEKS